MNILDFKKKKTAREKISCVTCYDYSSALILGASDIDCVLVGDSLAMTIYGHTSTVAATIEMMVPHIEAVARGLAAVNSKKFIIGDMPFQSYRRGTSAAIDAATELMRAGANAIKLEGANGNIETIEHMVQGGIPVMGHVGLTPQFVNTMGGFRVQGNTAEKYKKILEDAIALEKAGCFAIIIEGVPSLLGKQISETLKVPTIGIGAGTDCDGQVLVWQDFLGINQAFKPKFVRHYANQYGETLSVLNQIHADIRGGQYPNMDESY